ncbi:type II toxin-antitoxin system Phd/YefM family antitoxin [Luteolibacter sp. LG18]|uniref:type II toxin-antitoxin system Phd/YefM family antitoxin n=1 Tax=Luteolibacter sp. LG18 TaxID=2819286 RepID=UPI002B30C754|nr:hypothetical protein llg_17260 [Luteolibacter sp. LG18]
MQKVWQLQDAKNHFSEVVTQAMEHGAQTVTKHGKPAVVIVSAEEYRRLRQPEKSLVAVLRECPEDLSKWIGPRSKEPARNIRFE